MSNMIIVGKMGKYILGPLCFFYPILLNWSFISRRRLNKASGSGKAKHLDTLKLFHTFCAVYESDLEACGDVGGEEDGCGGVVIIWFLLWKVGVRVR